MKIDQDLEYAIREQSMFEDSALEDASAYARMITTGAERFKKEKQKCTVLLNFQQKQS